MESIYRILGPELSDFKVVLQNGNEVEVRKSI